MGWHEIIARLASLGNRRAIRAHLYLLSMFAAPAYFTVTESLPLRPKTSGEYISSALAGGTMNMPGVVARA